ncbi:CCD8A-like protein [Mya arenaria]|uniref:CCD8A-like protein n=1 Tax=Mya arenaria TaxID=6604 RepID=A0ABY7DBI0_MYAAR|nr:CCD8A-like protein [Mya arenaria]
MRTNLRGGNEDPGFELFFKTNLEEYTDFPIEFENPLPNWLKGTLIRYGMRSVTIRYDPLRSVTIRYDPLRSVTIRYVPLLHEDGVTPDFSEVEKIEALTRGIDNMNVNIYRFERNESKYDYVVLNDFWKAYTIDPLSLETKSSVTAKVPYIKETSPRFGFLNLLSSAHPLPEEGTSSHLTFLSSVSLVPLVKSTISLVRIHSLHQRELIAKWNVDTVPYMHSFSVTSNFAVLFASPFYVNTLKMVKNAEPFESLDWHGDQPTTVYIVNLKTKELTTLETENMFAMHHVNAFELGNHIVVDVSSYPNPDFVGNLQIDILLDPARRNGFDPHALLKRYVIDMESGLVERTHFDSPINVPFSANLDMPVINENYRHKEYCYTYGIVLKHDNMSLSNIALVKKNMCGDTTKDRSWILKGHYPVEPWFVQRLGSVQEDDGFLFVPIIDGKNQRSYIAMLDAKSMELVNKAYLPTIVPYNLHGRFFEDIV